MATGEFDPVNTPGGYVVLAYEMCPTARRVQSILTDGNAVGTHLGYQQEKVLIIRWHPRELNIEAIIQSHETKGFVREGDPKTVPAIDETVNLFNTEVTFRRYKAKFSDFNYGAEDAQIEE